jgi:riboflavin biosynthesis pyrimidine reductase
VRQIYPPQGGGEQLSLAGLYAYPEESPHADGRWLRANMITSADGAATADGRSGGLSGEADRMVFGLLRALADVVLVGAGTVRAEAYRPVKIGERWAGLREGRTPAPPIAVVSGRLALDPAGRLLHQAPSHARTIVITAESAPADWRAALAAKADVIVAGERRVDLGAAISALIALGHRRILTEGGPHLLGEITEAGLLDEFCLTVSPLLSGTGAGRIIQGTGPLTDARGAGPGRLFLAHVLEDQGYLLSRYLRRSGDAGQVTQVR